MKDKRDTYVIRTVVGIDDAGILQLPIKAFSFTKTNCAWLAVTHITFLNKTCFYVVAALTEKQPCIFICSPLFKLRAVLDIGCSILELDKSTLAPYI